VHLTQRGGRDGRALELLEVRRQRAAQLLLDDAHRGVAVERRHAVLQLLKLLDELRRQHIHARGELGVQWGEVEQQRA
jgi:hypothetical protein